MLSRIAENIYWMSRNLERVNNTARLIGINLNYLVEADEDFPDAISWEPLLKITGNQLAYDKLFPDDEVTADRVLDFMTREPSNPNSVLNCLRTARENARIIRDLISKEMWESMNDFWLQCDQQLKKRRLQKDWLAFHRFIRNGVALFDGLTINTMMRGEGFSFYQAGIFMERGDMTARIMDVKYHLLLPDVKMVGSALDYYQWAALLKSISGFEAYRRKVQEGFQPVHVAEFVLFDRDFPRSLIFTIEHLYEVLKRLGGSVIDHRSCAIASQLVDEWHETGIHEIFFERGLHEFLQTFLKKISSLHEALTRDFFTTYVE